MKKIIILLTGILCGVNLLSAQPIRQAHGEGGAQSARDWYNCSLDADGIYGADVNRAYEFLKGRKPGKRPVVAILNGGMDIEHEDLKAAIWTNPNEKPDGRDNDGNGYVDDLHGWNFLGRADGTPMDMTMREGDREFLRLRDKYDDYLSNDGRFYKFIGDVLTEVPAPEDVAEYYYFRNQVIPESVIGKSYMSWQMGRIIEDYGRMCDSVLRARFPDRTIMREDVRSVFHKPDITSDSIHGTAYIFIDIAFGIYATDDWDKIYTTYILRQKASARANYENNLANNGHDGRRDIVGDDYLDLRDVPYGNNELLSSNCAPAVMQAGIIAGGRNNGMGGDGIADAQIMSLRVAAGQGEPYLKDMALAMRYAVDNGADIIVLPQQNTLYPPVQREWMSDALRYAESRDVLVIAPVWELSEDLSKKTYYPNRWMAGGEELTNLMVVASSDKAGNPSMTANYGAREVDLFAPGVDIYSAFTGDTYRPGTGTALSAATVAGVAALVKSYFPHLTGPQIRQLLIDTVTSRNGEEVAKGIVVGNNYAQDLFLFEDLTLSGGIINAYNAVVKAGSVSE